MFADEARFGRMNRPRPCWAPLGTRPAVAAQLIREYVYLYGAVSPKDGTCVFELVADPAAKLARCFLRLANLPNYALDRDGKRSGLFRAQPPRPSSTLLKAGLCHRLFTWP